MTNHKLLSWNIQWGCGIDGRVDLVRTAAVAREFDADIICLQEVAVNHPDLPGMPDRLMGAPMDQAAWLGGLFLGYESVYGVGSDLPDGLRASGRRRQFGNLILSRLPILQVFRHLLPWPADPAVPSMQRVAVEADAPLLEHGPAPALVDAWSRVHGAVPPAPTFGVHDRRYIGEPACYDLFFVGENIIDRVVDIAVDSGTLASDHQPVVLTLSR